MIQTIGKPNRLAAIMPTVGKSHIIGKQMRPLTLEITCLVFQPPSRWLFSLVPFTATVLFIPLFQIDRAFLKSFAASLRSCGSRISLHGVSFENGESLRFQQDIRITDVVRYINGIQISDLFFYCLPCSNVGVLSFQPLGWVLFYLTHF